jgi:hypothetical protein
MSIGYSLKGIGVNNWALDKDIALNVLEKLEELGIAIAGGDVYMKTTDGFDLSYDNWYCNRNSKESYSDFMKRSITEAKSYINNYQSPNTVAFAIVPAIE